MGPGFLHDSMPDLGGPRTLLVELFFAPCWCPFSCPRRFRKLLSPRATPSNPIQRDSKEFFVGVFNLFVPVLLLPGKRRSGPSVCPSFWGSAVPLKAV